MMTDAARENLMSRRGGSLAEKWPLTALFLLLLVLRVFYACTIRLNSDETQHLHVVWGWTRGFLQYRDVFDNHTPLFHLLCAPIFALFGETPYIVVYMRLVMIGCFALTLWCTFRIGECLVSRRVGLWAALLTGYAPWFFLKTVEFRTDDLWTATWMLTVMLVIARPITPWRIFYVGLALGFTFGVSMKTTLLALALMVAGVITFLWWRIRGGRLPSQWVAQCGVAGVVGLLVVVAALVGLFAVFQATHLLYYGAIAHNLLPPSDRPWYTKAKWILFPLSLAVLAYGARFIFAQLSNRDLAARWSLLVLTAGFYLTLLHSYWPMITTQDYPPILPMLGVAVTPTILAASAFVTARWSWCPSWALPLGFVVASFVDSYLAIKPRSKIDGDNQYLARVLSVTNPSDYVMDAKCGAVYRRRPYYFALENVTRLKMDQRLIEDDIIDWLMATRTCMASEDRLKGNDVIFVEKNYLPFDHKMRVAGQFLRPDPVTGRVVFRVSIVAPYVFTTSEGVAKGTVDGRPFSRVAWLATGIHEFVAEQPEKPHALVWAQAFERGFRADFRTVGDPETRKP